MEELKMLMLAQQEAYRTAKDARKRADALEAEIKMTMITLGMHEALTINYYQKRDLCKKLGIDLVED